MNKKKIPKYQQIAQSIAKAIEERGGSLGKTQLELAEEYGVHRLTVREALNWLEREGKLRQMGGRVYGTPTGAPAVSHDAVPPPSSRSLAPQGKRKIGFPIWVDSLAELDLPRFHGYMQLAQGAHMELSGTGYELDIQCVGSKWQPNLAKIGQLCREWEALILTPWSRESAIPADHPFSAMRERTVFVGYLQEIQYNCVHPDHFEAGRLATEELVESGARTILYTGGEEGGNEVLAARFMTMVGVEKALEAHPDVQLLYTETGYHVDEAFSSVKRFLLEGGTCDAVLANSGYAALGALRALTDMGLRVPEDVQLIGIGLPIFWEYLVPKPTVVTAESYALGKEAARLAKILSQPKAAPQPQLILPIRLMKGETTRAFRRATAAAVDVRKERQTSVR